MNEINIEYIKTVNLQENGWLVNNSMSIPNEPLNRHYQEVQEWLKDNTPEPEFSDEELAKQAQSKAKQLRQELLKTITVTTEAGNVFDGDDIARADMLSAIQASETLGQDTATWKLSDNTWAEIDLNEMREASVLAIQAKSKILSGDSDV